MPLSMFLRVGFATSTTSSRVKCTQDCAGDNNSVRQGWPDERRTCCSDARLRPTWDKTVSPQSGMSRVTMGPDRAFWRHG